MITNNFFYEAENLNIHIIDFSTLNYFLNEELPKNFRVDEKKIYYKIIDNTEFVYIFTIKKRIPIFHGIINMEIFDILINKNNEARLKLIGTILETEHVINIVNRCFRCAVHDAKKIQLNK